MLFFLCEIITSENLWRPRWKFGDVSASLEQRWGGIGHGVKIKK